MAKEERKLTPAEERRKENLTRQQAELEAQGYTRRDLTVSTLAANLGALLMVPFCIAFGLLHGLLGRSTAFTLQDNLKILLLLPVLVVGHELIHGITWGLATGNHGRDIEFGVVRKYLTPYCTCASPISKRLYLWGAAMPTLILGFGLALLATALDCFWLHFAGQIMILGGGGDFLMMLVILKDRPKKDVLYLDHPYQVGSIVFER